jgi:hypothetical protein
MRKIIIASIIVSLSLIFAINAGAQQEDQRLNDKFRELQDQWNHIMQGEYNPSAIQPKVNAHLSLNSVSSVVKHSTKSVPKRSGSHRRSL